MQRSLLPSHLVYLSTTSTIAQRLHSQSDAESTALREMATPDLASLTRIRNAAEVTGDMLGKLDSLLIFMPSMLVDKRSHRTNINPLPRTPIHLRL